MNESDLRLHEREARRLRTQYAHDLVIRTILSLDLAIRSVARRLLTPSGRRGSYPIGRCQPVEHIREPRR